MKRLLAILVVGFSLAAGPAPAAEGFFTGNELLKNCTSGIAQENFCNGYLSGVF